MTWIIVDGGSLAEAVVVTVLMTAGFGVVGLVCVAVCYSCCDYAYDRAYERVP